MKLFPPNRLTTWRYGGVRDFSFCTSKIFWNLTYAMGRQKHIGVSACLYSIEGWHISTYSFVLRRIEIQMGDTWFPTIQIWISKKASIKRLQDKRFRALLRNEKSLLTKPSVKTVYDWVLQEYFTLNHMRRWRSQVPWIVTLFFFVLTSITCGF